MKLTPTQINALLRLADTGGELTPSGYSSAGRDASRWWRTMKILNGYGLVGWRIGTNFARLTPAGVLKANELRAEI